MRSVVSVSLLLAPLLVNSGVAPTARKCDKRSDERAKATWFYELPPADQMPPLAQITPYGAVVLLDEMAEGGKGCLYTQISYIGDDEAGRRFSNYEVWQLGVGAVIKGRVRFPDGHIEELTDDALTCGEHHDYSLLRLGPPTDPVRMFVHFPKLPPGSLVQFQVFSGCFGSRGDWLSRYFGSLSGRHRLIHGWEGSGSAFTLLDGYESRNYPAAAIRYVLLHPKSHRLEWKTYPPDTRLETREFPAPTSGHALQQFSLARPMIPSESYSPPFALLTPLIEVTYQDPSFKETGWDQLVNVIGSYGADKTPSAIARIDGIYPPHDIKGPLGLALHYTRFFRDRAEGDHYEFGTLIGVLKSKGYTVHQVWVRKRGERAIDRSVPSLEWFDGYLYAVDIEGRRTYLDPSSRIPAGALPDRFQGSEALVVSDRKHWEWVRLPELTAEENRWSRVVTFTAIEDGLVLGEVSETLTGTRAEGLRWLARETPSEVSRVALDLLRVDAVEGVTFSAPRVEGLADPEQPIVITASVAVTGSLHKFGNKTRFKPLIWRSGPAAHEFISEMRSTDIDFGLPESAVVRIRFPASWIAEGVAPLQVEERASGLSYRLSSRSEGGQWVIERMLASGGLQNRERYSEIRSTLSRIALADEAAIQLARE